MQHQFKLTRILFIALPLAALAIAGCGGGGSSQSGASNLSRDQILNILQRGFENGSRGSAALARSRSKKFQTRDHNEGHYYSDYLGLWVEDVEGFADDYESPSGFRFWVDEASTIPGGHELNWSSDPSVYPVKLRWELEYLEGTFKGEWEKFLAEINEDNSQKVTGSGNYRDEGAFEYEANWDDVGFGVFTGRWTFGDGTWETYRLERTDTNGPLFIITTSHGLTYRLQYRQDFSGTGTITGNAGGLPANVVWDENGDGIITWRDGSTSEIYIPPMY